MVEQSITDSAALGRLIRARRKELGLRQPDVAMTSGVGVRFIVDIENGKPTCQVGKVLTLMAALGIQLTGRYDPAPSLAKRRAPGAATAREGNPRQTANLDDLFYGDDDRQEELKP